MTKYYITEAQQPTPHIPILVISDNLVQAIQLYSKLNTNEIESITIIAPTQKHTLCYYWDAQGKVAFKEVPSTEKAKEKLLKHSVELIEEGIVLSSDEIGSISKSIKITLALFQEILDPKDFSDLIFTITLMSDKELDSIRNGQKET